MIIGLPHPILKVKSLGSKLAWFISPIEKKGNNELTCIWKVEAIGLIDYQTTGLLR